MHINKFFIRLPRHPLRRALVLVAGTTLLVGLLALGLLIGAAVVTFAGLAVLVRRWLRGRGGPRHDPAVIEGEFAVVPPGSRATLPAPERAPTTRSGW